MKIVMYRLTQQYTQAISSATLDNGGLNEDVERLKNPLKGEVDLSDTVRLSLDIFLGSFVEQTYCLIVQSISNTPD